MQSIKKINLLDVARLAGVSCSAAGKVLNGGSPAIRVGEEARKRILEAARTLNYQRNVAASILAGGTSRLIGVLLDSCFNYRGLRVFQEIESLCTARGYRLITSFSHDNIDQMVKDYQMMINYQVTGVICCSHDYVGMRKKMSRAFADARNIVFLEKPYGLSHPYVGTSRLKALEQMIAGALSHGKRRIMLCVGTDSLSERNLLHEFNTAMAQNHLAVLPESIAVFPCRYKNLIDYADQLIQKKILPYHPDVIYIDDEINTAMIHARLLSLKSDIIIQGGNGNPLFQGLGLSSFDPCYKEIAQALVNIVLLFSSHAFSSTVIESQYRLPENLKIY